MHLDEKQTEAKNKKLTWGLRQQQHSDDQLKRGSDEMHTCQSHLDEHSGRRTVRGPSAGKIADRLC